MGTHNSSPRQVLQSVELASTSIVKLGSPHLYFPNHNTYVLNYNEVSVVRFRLVWLNLMMPRKKRRARLVPHASLTIPWPAASWSTGGACKTKARSMRGKYNVRELVVPQLACQLASRRGIVPRLTTTCCHTIMLGEDSTHPTACWKSAVLVC